MLLRSRLIAVAAVGLASVLVACGDDDEKSGSTTATPTVTASSATVVPSPSATGADEKSTWPGDSPPPEPTSGNVATPPPPATTGKLAPRVADVSAFFGQFSNPPEDERQCVYNPGTRVIDCAGRGVYAPNPPPVGQGIECSFMASGGNSAAIRCEIADPRGAAYYDPR